MRQHIVSFVVCFGLLAGGKLAQADEVHPHDELHPHLAFSLNSGVAGWGNLKNEFALEAVFIGSLPLSGGFAIYAEVGFGTTFGAEQIYTMPLGAGVWYELNSNFAIGVAAAYCGKIGQFAEGSFLIGPLAQVTVMEHAGPFGPMSFVLIPGLAGQFLPGSHSGLGLGVTLGLEFQI